MTTQNYAANHTWWDIGEPVVSAHGDTVSLSWFNTRGIGYALHFKAENLDVLEELLDELRKVKEPGDYAQEAEDAIEAREER